MPKKKKKGRRSKAISVNLIKYAFVLGAAGYLTRGMSLSLSRDNLTIPLDNLKQNWWLLPMAFVVSMAGRIFGRFSPKIGIPGALSIKAI